MSQAPKVSDTTNLLLKKLVTATQDLAAGGGSYLTQAAADLRYFRLGANNVQTSDGEVSLPMLKSEGAWFSGGSSTTTKPAWLLEPSGATSNNWNTAGTGLGLNAPGGFAGDLLSLQVNGAEKFHVNSVGDVYSPTMFGFGGNNAISNTGSNTYEFLSNGNSIAKILTTGFQVTSGKDLKLGNAAVLETVVATHTMIIKDSNGTAYRVLCLV